MDAKPDILPNAANVGKTTLIIVLGINIKGVSIYLLLQIHVSHHSSSMSTIAETIIDHLKDSRAKSGDDSGDEIQENGSDGEDGYSDRL